MAETEVGVSEAEMGVRLEEAETEVEAMEAEMGEVSAEAKAEARVVEEKVAEATEAGTEVEMEVGMEAEVMEVEANAVVVTEVDLGREQREV